MGKQRGGNTHEDMMIVRVWIAITMFGIIFFLALATEEARYPGPEAVPWENKLRALLLAFVMTVSIAGML